MIYLDYAASTPVDDEVLDYFYEVTKNVYANPNSVHPLGLAAKKMLDEATEKIAKNLGVLPEEIIYTSGASEANNLVVKGICERYKTFGKHILLSSLEHQSLIAPASKMQEAGFDVELIPVTKEGLIDLNELKNMIREDTILVSTCYIDSEIGFKQPIEEIGNIVKEYPHCVFHTDASQAVGKLDTNFSNVDLVTIAPHKFYGMNGFGLLIKKKDIELVPIINGGRSTTIYRSGTPVLPQIAALDKALDIALKKQKARTKYVEKLNKKIITELSKYKEVYLNTREKSIPYVINFSIKGVKANDFVDYMGEQGICISAKTSCCPVEVPSKLVYALTHDKSLATSSVRVSLSHMTKEEEIDKFLEVFDNWYREFKDGEV